MAPCLVALAQWFPATLPRPRPQFPFDLNRPARVGAVKAFATYDYVILNSEFTDRWADCLGPFLSARCCRRLDELAAVDG